MAYGNCPNCYEVYDVKPQVCKKCGFPFKGNNENDKEYLRLFVMFNSKPTEELESIINSDSDYTDVAKRVAKDIIETGRLEYNERIKKFAEEQQKQEAMQQAIKEEKYQNTLTNPLYDDIHQIAGDLRFMKNLIIIGIVLSIFSGLITLMQMM